MPKRSAIFLFHRDLRIVDNTTLNALIESGEYDMVYPVFILTPEQIDRTKNPYFSDAAVQFMCESLVSLDSAIRASATGGRLNIIKGDTVSVLDSLLRKNDSIEAIYFNEDYSVYAGERDRAIEALCARHNIECIKREDYLLWELREGLRDGKTPYVVLAQFYNRYLKELEVRKPKTIAAVVNGKFAKLTGANTSGLNVIGVSDLKSLYIPVGAKRAQIGGREEGLKRMRYILPKLAKRYKESRDIPGDEDGTSRMSAHLKFGCVSVREFYWECVRVFGTRDHPLIRELIFREFYTKIYGLRPELQREQAYLDRLDKSIKWIREGDVGWMERWEAWTSGRTGFPLVDAAMRQLASSGFTHNRVRMVQGSFATRYLGLDWRDCARYYAST